MLSEGSNVLLTFEQYFVVVREPDFHVLNAISTVGVFTRLLQIDDGSNVLFFELRHNVEFFDQPIAESLGRHDIVVDPIGVEALQGWVLDGLPVLVGTALPTAHHANQFRLLREIAVDF